MLTLIGTEIVHIDDGKVIDHLYVCRDIRGVTFRTLYNNDDVIVILKQGYTSSIDATVYFYGVVDGKLERLIWDRIDLPITLHDFKVSVTGSPSKIVLYDVVYKYEAVEDNKKVSEYINTDKTLTIKIHKKDGVIDNIAIKNDLVTWLNNDNGLLIINEEDRLFIHNAKTSGYYTVPTHGISKYWFTGDVCWVYTRRDSDLVNTLIEVNLHQGVVPLLHNMKTKIHPNMRESMDSSTDVAVLNNGDLLVVNGVDLEVIEKQKRR